MFAQRTFYTTFKWVFDVKNVSTPSEEGDPRGDAQRGEMDGRALGRARLEVSDSRRTPIVR